MSTTVEKDAPWELANKLAYGIISKYTNSNGTRERALLARMDPLDPASDWNSASALYTNGMAECSGDNGYRPVELAVAVAVHLWARNTRAHMLGKSSAVSTEGRKGNLGTSLHEAVCKGQKGDTAILPGMSRRFASLTSAKSAETLYVNLRSVTSLIESKGVRIDYPKLAADLSTVFAGVNEINQNSPTFTRWNRGFWVEAPKFNKSTSETNSQN